MTRTSPDLRRAAMLLTSTNLVCTAIGASQALLVIRLLGADAYGSAAVVAALAAVATNVVDVRLIDLISNLYYDEHASHPTTGTAYRASALRLGLVLYAVSAGLIIVASAMLMAALAARFTGALPAHVLLVAALAQGVSYVGSFFVFIQRFTGAPRALAIVQIGSAVTNAVAMVAAVAGSPTVAGYVQGLLASAVGIGVLNAAYTLTALRRQQVNLFARRPADVPAVDRRLVRRFIAAGNVLGYVKLLHRSADVLLVAAFCGDRDTGIYKLARSITDALHAASEAVGRVYQPRLLALLRARAHAEYRAIARSLAFMAAAVTAAALVTLAVILPHVGGRLGVADARGLTPTVLILTLSFFLVAGVQSWLWPIFVSAGRTSRCTIWGLAAVVAGQYTVGPALVYVTGSASPAWFAAGYVSYYILSLGPLWYEARHAEPPVALIVQEARL